MYIAKIRNIKKMLHNNRIISIILIIALISSSVPYAPSESSYAAETGNVVDFNDQAYPSNWTVTGSGKFAARDSSGDYYLRYEAAGTAVKAVVNDAPSAVSAVDFSFDWKPERARAGGGYTYMSLRDGDNVIFELVNIGNWSNTNKSELAYRVGTGSGTSLVNFGTTASPVYYKSLDSTLTNFYGGPNSDASLSIWYTVSGKISFVKRNVEFTITNLSTNVVSDTFVIDIADSITNFDTFLMGFEKTNKNAAGDCLGIDNVAISYTGLSATDLASITQPEQVTIFQGDNDVLTLPTEVSATLGDGTKTTLQIDGDSWDAGGYTGDPGTYTYTANLIVPDNLSNWMNIKVKMSVVYLGYGRRDIISIAAMPDDVNVYKVDYADYVFPETVTVNFGDGSTEEVAIDQNSWTSVPAFDPEVEAVYTWSAGLAPEGDDKDPSGLKASFKMNYVLEKPDFDLFYDFTLGVWDYCAIGKDIHAQSGTGALNLTQKTDSTGNYYMQVDPNNSGFRMQGMPGLSSDSFRGTTVSFDWMPQSCATSGQMGEIIFVSTASSFPYFGLQFGSDMKIKYYNVGQNILSDWSAVTSTESLTGAISKDSAADTGITADGTTWYTVNIHFDYFAHTAELKISTRADSDNILFQQTVNIYASACNVNRMGVGGWYGRGIFGMDNVGVKYEYPLDTEIVDVVNPDSDIVAASEWDSFEFPTSVTVKTGKDSNTREVSVGEWTCSGFDKSQYGTYTWTAELTGLTDLTNPKKLVASMDIEYVEKHYVTSALNLDSLELTDVNDFDSTGADSSKHTWPNETKVMLSNGETKYFKVDSWVPAVGSTEGKNQYVQIGNNGGYLDADTEGIYVFKGKVEADEGYAANDIWVYFRINYYKNDTSGYYQYERSVENLDRGLYALPSVSGDTVKDDGVTTATNGVFVSWRILVDEYELVANGTNIVFDLYRNNEKIATLDSAKSSNVTSYQDNDGNVGDVYYVVSKQGTKKETSTSFTVTEKSYLPISVQKPDSMTSSDGEVATYSLNDCSAADVDGDGVYEIVVKWMPSNGFDSGKPGGPSCPTIFDCYRMDGTAVWRLYMGYSIPSGAHFNQFIFYDLNEDGGAEFGIKTGDGTRMYVPNAQGKFDIYDETTIVGVVGNRELEGTQIQSNGHTTEDANEYYTVFNGLTGEIIDTIAYPHPIISNSLWGDGYGNRAARFNANVGYIQKESGSTETIPAIFENRGYYNRTEVAAITLRNGKLNVDWDTVITNDTVNADRGNHSSAVGDLDNDGFDEFTLGEIAFDHDGTILWSQNGENNIDALEHADALHLTAAFPDTTQLYLFTPQEHAQCAVNYALSNAATGARLIGHYITNSDVGRGMMANITSDPGYEIWANCPNSETPDQVPIGGIYNVYGSVVAETKPVNFSCNWCSYWDGDLLSELPDSYNPSSAQKAQSIFKYNEETNTMDRIAVFEGTRTNNWTKNTPGLAADLIGDWREELVVPVDDGHDTAELRIYATTTQTDYSIYSLMQDPVYRSGVASQNSSYNQPPHLSYYLGEDQKDKVLTFQLPTYNLTYTWNDLESATLEPDNGIFYKNSINQSDVITTIKWNDAASVTDITKDGVSIGAEAYSVSGSALTIKKEYLAEQPKGNLELKVEFDKGEAADFIISIKYTTDSGAVISPDIGVFDKNKNYQADVVTTVIWNDATKITDIKIAGVSIGSDAYEVGQSTLSVSGSALAVSGSALAVSGSALAVSGSALTIKTDFLKTQQKGNLELTIEFDQGEAASFIITVIDSSISATINQYKKYYDKYCSTDIVSLITWNDVTSITDVKKAGTSIGTDAYEVVGNQLIIKKEYLALNSIGKLTLTVEFDAGDSAILTIDVIDTKPSSSTLNNTTTSDSATTSNSAPVLLAHDEVELDGVKESADFSIYKPDETGRVKVIVELPIEELLTEIKENGSVEKPLEFTVPLTSDQVLNELEDNNTKDVSIIITVPHSLMNNGNARMNLSLNKDILQAAKDNKKNVSVLIIDEKGTENYSWTFSSDVLQNSGKDMSDVNLSLDVEAFDNISQLVETLQNKKETKGLSINFYHEGILPAQSAVRIYVGDQEGIEPGNKIYLYHYNNSIRKLETLPNGSGYSVDADGYITINILHCSDYVVLTEKAASDSITSIRAQISVTPVTDTLIVGGITGSTTNIQVNLPVTLELVESLSDKTSGSAVGAVTVTYKSGNNQIATVDSNGKITAKGKGTTAIYTIITLYNGKTKTVKSMITVKDPYITITKSISSMEVGETFTFEVKAYGLDIGDAIWTTKEKSVLVINKNTGEATAISKGTDYVILKVGDKKKKIKVVVL